MFRTFPLLTGTMTVVATLAIGGCGDGLAGEAAQAKESPAVRESARACAMLAGLVVDPFVEDARPQPRDPAEVLADAKMRILKLETLVSPDPVTRAVAAEAAAAKNSLLEAQHRLHELEKKDGVPELLMIAGGILSGYYAVAGAGASSLLTTESKLQDERLRWGAAVNRVRAAQLLLPEAVALFAGPDVAREVLLVDFDEPITGRPAYDTIRLTNVSGQVLTNCTVLVELHGNDGDTRRNVHFVDHWAPGALRSAHYGIGLQVGSQFYGRQTVFGVQRVYVSLWSEELRKERIEYQYIGPERDRDIARDLDGRLSIRHLWLRPFFLGNDPTVELTLDGVPALPPSRLTLTFYRDAGTDTAVSRSWDVGPWQGGSIHRFRVTQLPWSPSRMKIEIMFPDSEYRYLRTVTLNP